MRPGPTAPLTWTALGLLCLASAAGCRGGKAERAYRVVTGGVAERGRLVIEREDCGSCHTIPGVRGARGKVAPPLFWFARRTYIAGQVPNSPEHLVRWVMDPHAIEPGTAMPDLGLEEQEARDVAAYLYTLE